jgi:hypothetical protein
MAPAPQLAAAARAVQLLTLVAGVQTSQVFAASTAPAAYVLPAISQSDEQMPPAQIILEATVQPEPWVPLGWLLQAVAEEAGSQIWHQFAGFVTPCR